MGGVADVTQNTACRVCGSSLEAPFLDLGNHPLANEYLPLDADPAEQDRFPLAVSACATCGLVQLTHTVSSERMFRDYPYFSSASDSFLRHAEAMAEDLCHRMGSGSGKRVVEIGSNDGYLLQYFQKEGARVLGIEPAANIADIAREKGIPTISEFFGAGTVPMVEKEIGKAHCFVGNNVLAHVPDPKAVLDAARRCLEPGGFLVFEVPSLADLLRNLEFDTIYHEHQCYFSLHALSEAASRCGLRVADVVWQPVHGGTMRVFFRPEAEAAPTPAVGEMLQKERDIVNESALARFDERVHELGRRLQALLEQLRKDGKRVAAYGAPAKGNTLLNTFGIGRDLIEFTVDRSPAKQGRALPGTGIPIRAPEKLLESMPDYAVVLPWNILREIKDQQREYLSRGGKLIVPIPEVTVVDATTSD